MGLWEDLSTSKGTSTTTATQQLTPEQQGLISMGLPFAQQFAASPPTAPQKSTVAGFNPTQQQAQAMALNTATGQQAGTAGGAAGAFDFLTSGAAMNPATNPGLAGAISAAQQPVMQNVTQNLLPQVRSEAVNAGQFGGSRQGVAEGIIGQQATETMGNIAANMENANYQNALDQMTKAMGLAPTVQQAEIAPAATTGAVGDIRQQQEQAQLTDEITRALMQQEIPLSVAQALMGLGAGLPGGSTTTTGTTTGQMSPLQAAIGGVTALGSLFGGKKT